MTTTLAQLTRKHLASAAGTSPCSSCAGCPLADRAEGAKLRPDCQPSAEQASRLADAVAAGDWSAYDKIAVMFSGGKDSLACVAKLIALGCPRDKIVLMHHDVDGREGSSLYDWAITRDYCRQVAEHLGVELRFSWRAGGFEGELFKTNAPTQPIRYELPDGTIGQSGGTGKPATRRRAPAKRASLASRWCSAVLKIDVGAAALRGDPTFNGGGSYLVVTGERREEAGMVGKQLKADGRATYAEIEAHRTDCKSRDVTQWRAVLDEGEAEVWGLVKSLGLRAHPCYELGFGRASCAFCIFASCDQLASLRELMPDRFAEHAQIEIDLQHTVDNKRSLTEMADAGSSFVGDKPAELRELAQSETYTAELFVGDAWRLPAGAFGDSAGPL